MIRKNHMINNNTLLVVIASFIVAVIGIASWVYVQNQRLNFNKQELSQEKQLVEYEQDQINKRHYYEVNH